MNILEAIEYYMDNGMSEEDAYLAVDIDFYLYDEEGDE